MEIGVDFYNIPFQNLVNFLTFSKFSHLFYSLKLSFLFDIFAFISFAELFSAVKHRGVDLF